jgi:Ca2+-binding RTX toxin-like protein
VFREFDAWGGSGDDEIDGTSENFECNLHRVLGGAGNDEITTASFIRGGSGNDIIDFGDCGGVAFGDAGDDELFGGRDQVVLHGGSGNDILIAGGSDNDDLFGGKGDDRLTGSSDSNDFDCGPGTDTITDFRPEEGDTKTTDCENF